MTDQNMVDEDIVLGIIGELYVAFGQGAGDVTVTRQVVDRICQGSLPIIKQRYREWSGDARVQALGVVKRMGRRAGDASRDRADRTMTAADFDNAAKAEIQQLAVMTPWCFAFLENLGLSLAGGAGV